MEHSSQEDIGGDGASLCHTAASSISSGANYVERSSAGSSSNCGCWGSGNCTLERVPSPADGRTHPINNAHHLADHDPTTLIAKEMNRLTVQEREKAYEDLHGVSAMVHETPELINRSLRKMEEQLQSVYTKPAYDIATTIREDYVKDPKLRMVFLRADRFDTHKAAKRFVAWLDWKLALFGREKLCRDIGLDDLNDDARFVVKAGLYQILPDRDSRGRVVLVLAGQYRHRFFRNIESGLQMSFYMHMCLAEDENNQKSGIVYIIYCLGKELEGDPRNSESPDDLSSTLKVSSLSACLPLRAEGMHFLTPGKGPMSAPFLFLAKSITNLMTARLRVHFGSHIECEYSLLSFGLPSSLLPFTNESELKTNNHKKWIQRRIVKEEEVKKHLQSPAVVGGRQDHHLTYIFPGIDLPTRNDVLLGPGIKIRSHAGNKRFNELFQIYKEEYNQAHPNNGSRSVVASKIVNEIRNPSRNTSLGIIGVDTNIHGRFLKLRQDKFKSGWWEEVHEEDVILEKIRNGFRNRRRTP